MRKLFIQEMVSVDGFFAGANGDISWHNVADVNGSMAEFNEFAIAMLNSVDTLIFGATTYKVMTDWWPKPDAVQNDPIVAGKMNSLTKIVFSKSLKEVTWNNSKLMNEIDADAIRKMKAGEGKDIVILGSGTIVKQFAELGLIDEYRLIINPVVLGVGETLFEGMKGPYNLKVQKTHEFKSGNVLVVYEPA